ncbi:Prolipoprotein diacylglyceryl transferase, partial [mine drainage metagenome]
ELFGRQTDVPWCMEFPMGGPICRHPSELYEAGMEGVLLFLLLFYLSRKDLPKGVVFWSFIGGYGVFRTIGEFFRQPDIQIGFLFDGITMGQLLSVPMAILGIGMAIRSGRVRSEGPSGLPPAKI